MIRKMKLSVMLLVFKTTTSQRGAGPHSFLQNDAALNFSASWMRAIVLCIKVVEILKVIFSYQIVPYQVHAGITDKAMSMFPELLRDAFLHADIPSSFYEAKKIIND
ncbi:hypothetical protein K1719_047436 [Acacia pycnantha]|nr:hypothetical protein K1719_047436 [Acacia pycnantha]